MVPCTPRCYSLSASPTYLCLNNPSPVAYVYLNLHEKGKVELAGVAVCEGVYFRLAHSWGLTISLAGSRSLLWVVRPCLWLVQKSDGGGGEWMREGVRGSGVCFLFMAPCFHSLQTLKKHCCCLIRPCFRRRWFKWRFCASR